MLTLSLAANYGDYLFCPIYPFLWLHWIRNTRAKFYSHKKKSKKGRFVESYRTNLFIYSEVQQNYDYFNFRDFFVYLIRIRFKINQNESENFSSTMFSYIIWYDRHVIRQSFTQHKINIISFVTLTAHLSIRCGCCTSSNFEIYPASTADRIWIKARAHGFNAGRARPMQFGCLR